jgi:ribonuclease E
MPTDSEQPVRAEPEQSMRVEAEQSVREEPEQSVRVEPEQPAMALESMAAAPQLGFEAEPVEPAPAVTPPVSPLVETTAQAVVTTGPARKEEPAPQPGVADTESILAALKLDWSSDLVQVETDPQKVQPVVLEEEEAPRARRVRRPLAPISDEPLIQVETRKRDTASEPASFEQV